MGEKKITEIPASRGIHEWGNVKENTPSASQSTPLKEGN